MECKRSAALDRCKRFAYVGCMDSEPKFTAGPWVVDASSDGRSGMSVRTADPLCDGADKGLRICRLSRVPGTSRGRMIANARLIAAAPKMYEAHKANEQDADAAAQCLPSLSGILEAIEKGHTNEIQDALTGVQEAIDAIRARSRAALAMVEGK